MAYADVDVLSVFDADTYELIATVDLVAGALHSVAVNPVTGKVYVVNAGPGSVSIVDGGTNLIAKSIDVAAQSQFFGIASILVNPSTNRIYVARVGKVYRDHGLAVIDGETDAEIAQVRLDGAAGNMAIDPASNDLYVKEENSAQELTLCPFYLTLVVIDTEDNSLRECLDFGYYPLAVAISRDGSTLYHMSNGMTYTDSPRVTNLTIVELPTRRALATIEYPEFTTKRMTIHPDTNRLYVMGDDSGDCCHLGHSGQLLAIDADAKSIAWSVPVDSGPIDFAADFDSHRFYLVTADRTLHIVQE